MTKHAHGVRMRPVLLSVALCLLGAACGKSESTDKTADAAPPPRVEPEAQTAKQPVPAESEATMSVEAAPAAVESEPMPEQMDATTMPMEDTSVEPDGGEAVAQEGTAPAAPVDGGDIYTTYCVVCHKAGMNGAPKYGNKLLWGRVVVQGREKVYGAAINGLRGMPPRGGFAFLSDEQVKAAVDYMVAGSGGWKDN
jgi:cytochrome c5